MILVARSFAPTPFTENPGQWYLEHWETASEPYCVEWASRESLFFLLIHISAGLFFLAILLAVLVRWYFSNGARLSKIQRCSLAVGMLLTAFVSFAILWNGTSRQTFPHVSNDSRMLLLGIGYGLALIVPTVLTLATLFVLMGNKRAKAPAKTELH
jgi:hypothetical protein